MERLRPGLHVNLMFDMASPYLAMKASIYDVIGSRIVISQTSPPLLLSHLGKEVNVSFIVSNKDKKVTRYGFVAGVIKLIPGYEMFSSRKVPAVLLEQKSKIKEINRRMFYRINPPLDSQIKILLGNENVDVIDISLGGARIKQGRRILEPDEEIRLTFLIDYKHFTVPAKVVRVDQAGSSAQIISIRFDSNEQEFGNILSMKILMMERQLLAKEKY